MINTFVPFNTERSASAVRIENAPIQTVAINNSKVGEMGRKMSYKEAINQLTPGDIFTLENSNSRIKDMKDGLYLVTGKEDYLNKGLKLARLDSNAKDNKPIKTIGGNKLITDYMLKGDVEIAGSLDIQA